MKLSINFVMLALVPLMSHGKARADVAKSYVPASWLSDEENKRNAENFSIMGTVVTINRGESNPGDGEYYALRYFAAAIKRYQQATRFVVVWHNTFTDDEYFSRWVYDRNQQTAYTQSSKNGETEWNGFCVTEPVGVTDEMIQQAALEKSNAVLDLIKYGAINRRQYWEGHWIAIPKSDPRVAMARRKFLELQQAKT